MPIVPMEQPTRQIAVEMELFFHACLLDQSTMFLCQWFINKEGVPPLELCFSSCKFFANRSTFFTSLSALFTRSMM